MALFRRRRPRPTEVSVKLKLPFVGEFGGTWKPQRAESEAAWELYVELVTRVAVVDLRPGEGLAREALTSLYSVFGTTREILRKYGPAVAPRDADGDVTFGTLAMTVLNSTLRPLLTTWHPRLRSWEARCGDDDPVEHENRWEHIGQLRTELADTRRSLAELADLLAEVAGAASLTAGSTKPDPEKSGGGVSPEPGCGIRSSNWPLAGHRPLAHRHPQLRRCAPRRPLAHRHPQRRRCAPVK